MAKRLSRGGILAGISRLMSIGRARYSADVSPSASAPAPKLEPIEKIVANTGRGESTSPVD